jgi:hypothetical protein
LPELAHLVAGHHAGHRAAGAVLHLPMSPMGLSVEGVDDLLSFHARLECGVQIVRRIKKVDEINQDSG